MKNFGLILILIFPLCLWAQGEAPSYPNWKWKGDFRLRAQQETTWPADMRLSERIRLRFGVKVELEKDLMTEIRLATSKANNSTNQTLGDDKEPGFTRRFIGLDLAYAEWKALPFMKLEAGRIPQVHYRPGDSQILLDSDLALEGAALVFEHSYDENLDLFGNFGSTWIRENYDAYYSENLTDNMLNWGQAGVKWKVAETITALGAGFFNYTALQGMNFADVSTGGASRGNSEGPVGAFKYNYIPRQYFVESKFPLGAYRMKIFIEHVINGEVAASNKAWWTGFSMGQEKWKAQLAYAELQSDPVPGIFTDSDFAGGTPDCKGFVLSGSYQLRKKLSLSLSQYMNRKRVGLEDTQYSRTHLDLVAEF